MHPVRWKDQTYYMGELTVGAKAAFCKWAKRWHSMEQIQTLGDVPHVLNPVLASLSSLLWWGDRGMSKLVSETLEHPAGNLYLNRLLFGDSVKLLSDTELQEMISAKEAEQERANVKAMEAKMQPPFPPVNDYFLALRAVKEESDPKAGAAGTDPAAG